MTTHKRKYLACFLAISIICTMLPALSVSASQLPASESYNLSVTKRAKIIKDKFLVNISYPMRTDGYAAVGAASLLTLEGSLNYATPQFVRQLSQYYYDTYGSYLTFEFVYMNEKNPVDPGALGLFTSNDSTIQIFLPTTESNSILSGCSPLTILHELGHAYQLFLSNKIGIDRLKDHWNSANGSLSYNQSAIKNPDKCVFISVYGSRCFEEDFAETFAYIFASNRTGLGISDRFYNVDASTTGLGMKVNLIEGSITQFFENPDPITENINKMRATQTFLTYRNHSLSGNSLEYISFNPPNGVLENVLKSLKITAVKTDWINEVGGWKVWDKSGGVYLVFPGAKYVTLKIPVKKSH